MGWLIPPYIFFGTKNKKGYQYMPEKTPYYVPNKLYKVEVKIKDLDYTNDTVEVILTSSLSTAYQVIDITFLLDPSDVIIEDIFGGEPIRLNITLLRESDYPGPRFDVELLYLTSNLQLTANKTLDKNQVKERTNITITTVARNPYVTMVSMINDVFVGVNLNQIISSLASSVGASLEFDSFNRNNSVIDQVCIPPTTFYKVIKEYNRGSNDIFDGYLDQRFGLFSGTPGVFCQYDNKVYIKNLTGKLKRDQAFTVYQLAAGEDNKITKKIYDDSIEGKVFYTYDALETDYSGNSVFADLASDINHIIKPKNTLTSTISQNLESVAQDYSLLYTTKNKNLFIDPYVKRKKYYNDDTGYETESTLFNSRFGRSISDLSTLSLNLERNLPLLNLIDVGECVKLKPLSIEFIDFEGKYILWSSVIKLSKSGPSWETTATINLTRTNKKN
jgi:hypothetical protein